MRSRFIRLWKLASPLSSTHHWSCIPRRSHLGLRSGPGHRPPNRWSWCARTGDCSGSRDMLGVATCAAEVPPATSVSAAQKLTNGKMQRHVDRGGAALTTIGRQLFSDVLTLAETSRPHRPEASRFTIETSSPPLPHACGSARCRSDLWSRGARCGKDGGPAVLITLTTTSRPLWRSFAVLLNLDKPLKRATLHNEFCSMVPKPHGTKLKPFGHMGPDGGWFEVKSEAQAALVARSHLPGAQVTRCPRC